MYMEVVLLGTSSMVPTIERNHSSAWLKYENENILIDCGEGTQRQIKKAHLSAMKITKILITHWHGDHVLGLPGLFLTLGMQDFSGIIVSRFFQERHGCPQIRILGFDGIFSPHSYQTNLVFL